MNSGSRIFAAVGAIVLLVLVLVGVVAWRNGHVQVERTVDAPRTGEAASNPLYLLKLALQSDGVKVDARQRLLLATHTLGPRDTVLIYSDPRSLAPSDAQRLLSWVERGGHLIVRTPPWHERIGSSPVPVLAELGVTLLDADDAGSEEGLRNDCVGLYERGQDPQSLFCGERRFYFYNSDVEPQFAWGDEDTAYVYARFPHGEGSVDVLADTEFLSNRGGGSLLFGGPRTGDEPIAAPGSAAFARQLLAPNYRDGTVHLIYAADVPSLWKTLLVNSWMAWLPLLVWLAGWLWQRMQRFGPLRPAPAMERRSLLEHIVASGEHLYRYGYAGSLHAAVRTAFLARLRRRDPYAASIQGEPQVELLAQRYKHDPSLGVAAIRDALATPLARDHAAFRARIATLIRMRNRL